MSSSKDARRFAVGFAVGLALAIGASLSLTWLIDPDGVLAPWGGGGLCAPGGKVQPNMAQRALLIDAYRPREAILGSSRAMWMFSEATAPDRANLGFSSATFDQIDGLARRFIVGEGTKRLWIGLDSGAFLLDRPNPQPPLPVVLGSPWASTFLRGWMSPVAWGESLEAIVTGACRNPITTPMGFVRGAPSGSDPDRIRIGDERHQRDMIEGWSGTPRDAALRARARLEQFSDLLRLARAHGTNVVLFLTPSHPRYHTFLREAGLADLQARWHAAVLHLAERYEIPVVDADDPRFLIASAGASCSPPRSVADCAFFDIAHARPVIGNAIIRAGNGMARRSFPRP